MSIDFFYGYVAGLAVAVVLIVAWAVRRRVAPRCDEAIGQATIMFSFKPGTTTVSANFQFPSSYEAALAYEDFKEAAEKRAAILIQAGHPAK